MPDSRKRVADIAFLAALFIYVLAGTALTPPHGDEFMQMSMARDTFYVLGGQWNKLAYSPPLIPDTEEYQRLINGTINKSLIGLAWMLSGRGAESLPGIYAWGNPYDWNQQQGNVPSDDQLATARWPSALLTALGVLPMFYIGWQIRRRSVAYPAAVLFALHPVILLNGRRAMMEGSLMLFSLLTIAWLITLVIAEHSASAGDSVKRLHPAVRYAILGVLAGLAVASKHTGLVVAVAALAGALIAGLSRDRSWRPLAWIGLAGVVAFAVWFAFNPGYWNDPLGAAQATLKARTDLLAFQSSGNLGYANLGQRFQGVLAEPFLTPPQFYESESWAALIAPQITAYQDSDIDGWNWGPIIGVVLTLLAGIGLVVVIYDSLHHDKIAWIILIWVAATSVAAMAVPLAWQRYYLPVLLVAIILAAEGLGRLLVRRPAEMKTPAGVAAPEPAL
ncbi:MAG TPA: phospholipid carrier-dependent glycosyltransferase [Aggregatilineales bacterium]|nr:phospholipid carrier-dependent glycosyltransferase [Aggregatilineales bacterium]